MKSSLLIKYIFFISILIGSIFNQCKAEWILFNNKSDEIQTFLDYQSASRDGDIVKIKKLANANLPGGIKSALVEMYFDCNKKKSAMGLLTFYSASFGKGNVLLRQEDPLEWMTNKSGSENDIALKLACDKIKR